MKKENRFILFVSGIVVLLGILLAILTFVIKDINYTLWLLYVIFSSLIAFIMYSFYRYNLERDEYNSNMIDKSVEDAINLANVGIVVYNEDFTITWMSEIFYRRKLNKINEKLLNWIPELSDLLKGNIDTVCVNIGENKYEVYKKEDASVLLFNDITSVIDLKQKYEDEAVVFGMINFDNYDEAAEIEDDIGIISNEIKLPVYEYLKKFDVTYKTLRNSRLFLILNEKTYHELADDKFSIINNVRKEAKKLDIPITLSMAFARGTDDFGELDEMLSDLIDLAQTRGGDQVVVRKMNEEAKFFGGSSEAKEKSSKVRVRVMANTIKDLIVRSSNVIIVGHLEMDADCVGSALCMSEIAQSFKKETFVVTKTGGIESTINNVMIKYEDELESRHKFVTINEASNHLNDDSLVIMVDHHSAAQSNGKNILENAKRIVVVDHHRRKADLDINPLLVYIEASSSSTCELVCEFLPYLTRKGLITPLIANIMYLGILIDTNRFRMRTGVRTFDVCRMLRQFGADPSDVEKLNEEPYDMIIKRSILIRNSILFKEGLLISAVNDDIFNRTVISQAGDQMLQTSGVKAVFVIAHISKDEVAISARSKGEFNVQVVMEKMNGGGHMTAAGLQTKEFSVLELKEQLLRALEEYLKEL